MSELIKPVLLHAVEAAIEAAHDRDATLFKTTIGRLSTEFDVYDQRLAWLYTDALLLHSVVEAVGGTPNRYDLDHLADKHQAEFVQVLRDLSEVSGRADSLNDRALLRSVLATAFDDPAIEPSAGAWTTGIAAIVIVGLLVDDPHQALARAEPFLSRWLSKREHVVAMLTGKTRRARLAGRARVRLAIAFGNYR